MRTLVTMSLYTLFALALALAATPARRPRRQRWKSSTKPRAKRPATPATSRSKGNRRSRSKADAVVGATLEESSAGAHHYALEAEEQHCLGANWIYDASWEIHDSLQEPHDSIEIEPAE